MSQERSTPRPSVKPPLKAAEPEKPKPKQYGPTGMNETLTHDKKAHAETKTETAKPVHSEATGSAEPVVRFKVDGLIKSLNKPVRGTDLYRVAGEPKLLKLGSKEIANDYQLVEIDDDAELKIVR
jgi:hypothetical protein